MTKKFSKKRLAVIFTILTLAVLFIFLRNRDRNSDQVYVEVKTVHTALGWGYDILTDGKVYIHQEFIPAIPGRFGFKTEEDALKVGRKVISKISQKELPSISISDLKELGIVYDSVAGR
jgi:hypothetical protein